MNTIEKVEAVLMDLRWILRTCRVASVLPIATFEQALTLSGVAQVQAVRDGRAEIHKCIDIEVLAGHSMSAGFLDTATWLVKYI